ncbi:hypothetical protein T05_12989 [Trichinella murrelli]|uniref:Uncharacterized protein n=1 Tax=Trichinella murrelli TaxID=144512 RepID=A0A0V0SUH8_9BILA|nr:hypothetical protein T05_12989 [Trichinella murrelli]
MPFRFLAKVQKFKKDGLLEDFQLPRLKRNDRDGYVVCAFEIILKDEC